MSTVLAKSGPTEEMKVPRFNVMMKYVPIQYFTVITSRDVPYREHTRWRPVISALGSQVRQAECVSLAGPYGGIAGNVCRPGQGAIRRGELQGSRTASLRVRVELRGQSDAVLMYHERTYMQIYKK